jgi:hypothetical protein
MKFETLQKIADTISRGDIQDLPGLIEDILATIPEWHCTRGKSDADFIGPIAKRSHWHRDLNKLALVAIDGVPRFTVHVIGNGKLPFMAFSSLPGRGFCPGAGDCLKWCYSFLAWRYPAAFCRQAQNSILMLTERGALEILAALDTTTAKIARKQSSPEKIDFRLYVDGDFQTRQQFDFWMQSIAARPELRVYGYSKSWAEISDHAARGGIMPANYQLNLSSGSVHGLHAKRIMESLPITRGEFVAVNIGRSVKSTDHGTREHNRELRAAYKAQTGRKAFTCPGKCGDCTPTGHACGSDRFKNVDIIIAVH